MSDDAYIRCACGNHLRVPADAAGLMVGPGSYCGQCGQFGRFKVVRGEDADLFGESDTRFSGNPNAYRGKPGAGPAGKTCGDCRHAHKHLRYWKCGLVKPTASEATDIRLKTPACERFEER